MRFLTVFVLTLLSLHATTENFDRDWRFARFGLMPDGSTRPEPAQLASPASDDSAWRTLDLPHDWGIEGPFRSDLDGETGKLPWAGIGWYRKTFTLPAPPSPPARQRLYLQLDGAMANAEVFINNHAVGGWPYGYTSFRVELTPHLKFGNEPNTIAIRLDNKPDSSRWYPGAGLYRHVWLLTLPASHLDRDSIFVRATTLTAEKATLQIDAKLAHPANTEHRATYHHEIRRADAPDRILASGQTTSGSLALTLPRPALWDLDHPTLHLLRTSLEIDGQIVDTLETPFGLRTAEFRADGFYLNDRRVALQGVCEHHDLGPLGTALNLRALQRKLDLLRHMGCNAIRTSHNPPAPEFLTLCDQMGFLVINELFDGWKIAKTPNDYSVHFDAWHERDVHAFVRRDRNHPCVIAWSSGNEIMEQLAPDGVKIAHRLRDLFHAEDPTRPVIGGLNKPESIANGFHAGFDLVGFNYRPWRYAAARAALPDKPMLVTESASTVSSRGVYLFPVVEKLANGLTPFQVSSYDLYFPRWAHTPDHEWQALAENPTFAGEFVWTGFDYLGEPTPYNQSESTLLNYDTPEARALAAEEMKRLGGQLPARSSYFGILDLCGFPKDRFYLYQSRWRPDYAMAHLLPHWSWPGREGEVTPVHVYTSGDEAELFLNGKSLGRKKKLKSEYRLRWDDVKYAPGELKAIAYKNGQPWAETVQRTAGPAAKLALTAERPTLRASVDDLAYLAVRITDADGTLAPHAQNKIRFRVAGPGEIIAVCNGDAASLEPFQSTEISAFNALAQVIVRAIPGAQGSITVTAESNGLDASSASISIVP